MAVRFGSFVFCERKSTNTLARECNIPGICTEQVLEGYQIYIVEQWVSDRKKPYNTVTIFTGNAEHKVKVCVINLDKDKLQPYPKKIQQLFDSLEQDNTRPKDTTFGTIMVTNLSTLPSSLNTVLVPDGDYELNIGNFYINLNLRKMGCSHRRALSLAEPSEAQQEKFIQIYKISTHIDFTYAVLELIKLVQTALYLFGLFPPYYIDGLLCDTTLDALQTFHNKFASSEVELRKNSIDNNLLDRSLVAVLLSKVMSIRNKLGSLGYQVGKDPFTDPEGFRSAVASFQKNAKINATRFIDQYTIEKIKVYKKSKIEDLSNKVLKAKTEDITYGSVEKNLEEVFCAMFPTKRTGEVFRGFKEGVNKNFSSLAHRKFIPREFGFPRQSLIVCNTMESSSHKSVQYAIEISKSPHLSSRYQLLDCEETELSQDDQPIQRRHSFSTFETIRDMQQYPPFLKRSHSLHSIDEYRVAMNKNLLYENIQTNLLYENIQTNLLYEILKRKVSLSKLVQKLEDTSNEYAEQIEQFSQAYQKRFSEYKSTEKNALEVFSRQQAIGKTIEQIDFNSAKLNYELDVLKDKLQEIEEFVDTFCLKVQFLESQMPQPSRFAQILPRFYNYLQIQWNNIVASRFTNSTDNS
ncbi:564_t:CDS:10 [Ambispora leptoticha]|uniref:564_t:CDS:1 n=1 Tax=Ambispora leptoticha TaxID=144679 RepID=A0A9N8V5D4_9GLOM|nr:564_t:CDS:10 [Ambispora leptoticha]